MGYASSLAKLVVGAVAIAGVAGHGTANANPVGVTYLVQVTTSFGTSFADCFSFDKTGTMTVGGYGTLTYAFQSHGNNKKKYQAVSPITSAEGAGFAIQFNGYTLGHKVDGYTLTNGSNEFGDSFVASGPAVSSCTAAARSPALYRPAS